MISGNGQLAEIEDKIKRTKVSKEACE